MGNPFKFLNGAKIVDTWFDEENKLRAIVFEKDGQKFTVEPSVPTPLEITEGERKASYLWRKVDEEEDP